VSLSARICFGPMAAFPTSADEGGGDDAADSCVRIAGGAGSGLILLCDHASNRIPSEFGDLGLPHGELSRHIAYDPGAAAVTRAVAARMAVPAVVSTFSRLLIDPNRGEDDPTLVMRLSDGTVIPGNARIDDDEKRARIARFYEPYHAAIDTEIDCQRDSGVIPALVAIHSFTPVWRGRARPWHVGILWDRDRRLAAPLIAALAADSTLIVGDNEPYTGALQGDTLYRHGTCRGLAHVLIELRQDLIADEGGADEWGERLAAILSELNCRPEIHEICHHGSRIDPMEPICKAATRENTGDRHGGNQ
jgi:predicted N-formylglutamate amidohydrolase